MHFIPYCKTFSLDNLPEGYLEAVEEHYQTLLILNDNHYRLGREEVVFLEEVEHLFPQFIR